MLGLLLRDVEHSASEALPSALSLIERRSLIASADATTLDAWSARLTALLSPPGTTPEVRVAAAMLLRETVRQCAEPAFARHRESWCAALLHLLQPPNASSAGANAPDTAAAGTRLAAVEALMQMVEATSTWPAERREMTGVLTRLTSTLTAMLGEPASQRGAACALFSLCLTAPHSLRAHRDKLSERLPAIALEAPLPTARGACELLGALPICLPASSVQEAWLLTVQRLCGTYQLSLSHILGSVTSRPALRYELPAYPLPHDAAPAAAASNALASKRREALLRSVRRCALGIHYCLCPSGAWDVDASAAGGGGGSGGVELPGMLPVPVDMLIELAMHTLSVDGALSQRAPAEGSLSHSELLLILADVYVSALQLLHSTVLAAKRHMLAHAQPIATLLRRLWRLSGSSGPAHLRDGTFRAAVYALATTMLDVLGPCAAPLLAHALTHAALADLPAPPTVPRAGEAARANGGGASADDQPASGGGKRQRTGGGGGAGASAHVASLSPCVADALQAVRALLLCGSEMVPLALLGSLQSALLHACSPAALALPAPTLALALAALHAAVGTGRALQAGLIPLALAAFQHWAAHGEPAPRAAAQTALHALDALLHPSGVLVWGAPEDAEGTEAGAAGKSDAAMGSGAHPSLQAMSHLLSSSQPTILPPGPLAPTPPAPLPSAPPTLAPPTLAPPSAPLPPAPQPLAPPPSLAASAPLSKPPTKAVAAAVPPVPPLPPAPAPRQTRAAAAAVEETEGSDSDVELVDVGPDDADRA